MSEALRTVDLQTAPPGDAGAHVFSRRDLLRLATAGLLSTATGCFRPQTEATQAPVVFSAASYNMPAAVLPEPEPVQPQTLGEIPVGKDLRNTMLRIGDIEIGLFIEEKQVMIRCGDNSYRIKNIVTAKDEKTKTETCMELSEDRIQKAGCMIGLRRTEKGLSGSVFWIGGEVAEDDLMKVATELAAPRMIEDEGDIRLDLPLVGNRVQSLTLVQNKESVE